MTLTFEDIYSFIELLPESDTITLIGGQALNFWTELYFHNNPEFYKKYGPFTSMDIDFLGGKSEIIECAENWGGTVKLSDPFDITPNSGIVIIPFKAGENLIVDFLTSVHGLTDAEVLKHRIKIRYKNAGFYVIHPIHCLKSRIVNLIGLYRNDQVSLSRVEIAIAIVNKRIIQLVYENRKRQALDEIEMVFRLSCNSMFGIPLYTDYGLDIFEAVPKTSCLGDMFLTRRYPQMKQILDTKRNRRKLSDEK